VARADGVEAVIRRTVDAFGGLDILVKNVGVARGAGIVDTTDDEWQEAFDPTLFPAGRASRRAVPPIRQRGGGGRVTCASVWWRRDCDDRVDLGSRVGRADDL